MVTLTDLPPVPLPLISFVFKPILDRFRGFHRKWLISSFYFPPPADAGAITATLICIPRRLPFSDEHLNSQLSVPIPGHNLESSINQRGLNDWLNYLFAMAVLNWTQCCLSRSDGSGSRGSGPEICTEINARNSITSGVDRDQSRHTHVWCVLHPRPPTPI